MNPAALRSFRQVHRHDSPQSEVVIENGEVVEVRDWLDVNGEASLQAEIRRFSSGPWAGTFTATFDERDAVCGTLKEVLSPLDAGLADWYRRLFELANVTDATLAAVGYGHYQIAYR